MARGDPIFAKLDADIILHGESFNALREEHQAVYMKLWVLAVKHRTDWFMIDRMPLTFLASCVHSSRQLVASCLKEMCEHGLAKRSERGDIYIVGVKDCHKKLKWDKCPIWGQNGGPKTSPSLRHSESPRVRDIITDPDIEIVTQRRTKPEPGSTGSVDVKKLLKEAEQESDRKRAERAGGNGDGNVGDEPWNQVSQESELELEVHRWFLELWPDGEYDWDAEKDSLLSQVRRYGRGRFNQAIVALKEKRRRFEFIESEIAWLCHKAKMIENQPRGGR